MYVCICHSVTDKMIRAAAAEGAASIEDLERMTGCGTGCGSCVEMAEAVLHATGRVPLPVPLLSSARTA